MTALFAAGSSPTLGELLRQLRQKRHLSQEELAQGLCARSYISQLERDLRFPSPFLLVSLARRLGAPLELLVDGALRSSMVSFQHLAAWARHLLWIEGATGEKVLSLYRRMMELYQASERPAAWEAEMKEVLALFHYRGGELQVARTLFYQAAEKGRGYPLVVARCRTGESLCLWQEGRRERAAENLRDLWISMALWDPSLRREEEVKAWLAEVGTLLAFMELKQSREAAALLVLELTRGWALDRCEDDLSPWRQFVEGKAQMALGQLEKARATWTAWLSLWPKHELSPWAWASALELSSQGGEEPPLPFGTGVLLAGEFPPPPRFLRPPVSERSSQV